MGRGMVVCWNRRGLFALLLALAGAAATDGRDGKSGRGKGFPKEGPAGGGFAGRGTDITGLRLEDVSMGMHSL